MSTLKDALVAAGYVEGQLLAHGFTEESVALYQLRIVIAKIREALGVQP